uniref:AIG1-type G domain-containing protein n=1 Tax=Stegastes partitus TaxID=144197 RepID=A0A3B5BCH3_9TELE
MEILQFLRIMLVGKDGAAKKSAVDTILNSSAKDEETAETKISVDPEECQHFKVKIEGRDVEVFDTPVFCHTQREDERTMEEIKKCVSRVDSGLHGFLVVFDLEPFTREEKDMVQMLHTSFGDSVKDYMMPLFVNGNELKRNGKTIRGFINDNKDLEEFVRGCEGETCVIDHRNQDSTQVGDLLRQINIMVQGNKAKKRGCYTASMLEDAESGPGNKRKMALSANGGMLVGGAIGGGASHSVGSMIGIPGGIFVGALVGGLMGTAGILMYVRAKRCFKR